MHRFRSLARLAPLAAVLLLGSGCSSNDSSTAPAPLSPTLGETFTGTLALHGGTSYAFTVTGAGSVTATLTSLLPDSARPVGLSLGTWNGSICQVVLSNDNTIQGQEVVGQSSGTGTFCVRVYDSAGTVTQPQTYVVDVSHP
jgi:hypothetical protein